MNYRTAHNYKNYRSLSDASLTRITNRQRLPHGDKCLALARSCYHVLMSDESTTTGHDVPRPAATDRENDFLLSIEEVSERYARAGHPRTIRTLQRYSASGHLDAQKVATTLGDKYLVTPQSVARHIAQIEELSALDTVATDRDQPRQVATPVVPQEPQQNPEPSAATSSDTHRQAATDEKEASRYVERLEREVELAQDERDFLREQINRKDKTIESLLERDRETNFLIRGLQDLIPRLPPPDHNQTRPSQT